jgi:nitrate reductase assembly molybdenum cofactor insertion protein NarJ
VGAEVDTEVLRARGVAFAFLARLLGSDTSSLCDADTVAAARVALRAACADVEVVPEAGPLDGAALAATWVRWFDLGRVAPYEGSNVASTAGGVTPRLADVAGFYRAFGFAVHGDRPDHVVAQLEFLAVALLAEADAIEAGDTGRAADAGAALRSFLRDHAGVWIDAWASRVGAIPDLAPWAPWALAAAVVVRAEAARRNVIPLRSAAVLAADAGVADDDEAIMACEDEDPEAAAAGRW